MKKKMPFSDHLLYSAIFAVLVQLFVIKNANSYSLHISDFTNTGYNGVVNDSMPDHRNLVIADSIKRRKICYEQPALQTDPWLFRLFARLIKINEANICDSSLPALATKYNYFMVLPGYRVQTGTNFYMDSGQYFFQTNDPAIKDESGEKAAFTSRKIDVRFSKRYARDIDLATQPGYLLIPIKEKNFKTARILVYGFAIMLALYVAWVLIVLPLKMLYSIARKKVFSLQNIRYCVIIGWSLIAFALLPIVAGVLFYFIFRNNQPDEISFFVTDIASEINGILLAGLLVLLLRRILKDGYLSQLHKELTI